MTRFLAFFSAFIVALSFHANEILAQKKNQTSEAVIVEFSISNIEPAKFEIPVPKNKYQPETFSTFSECLFCTTPEEYAGSNTYVFSSQAFKLNKNATKIIVRIEVDNCRVEKSFIVYRRQKKHLQLGCEVDLKAQYGLKTEKAN